MKLYLINQYEAYQAAEPGVATVRELPNETAYYKYELLAEADVELPEGFKVAKTNGGGTAIFFGNEGAYMITERQGEHYVTSLVTSQGITAIKEWDALWDECLRQNSIANINLKDSDMNVVDKTSLLCSAIAAALFTITGSAIAAAIGLGIILATSLIHLITNN